METSTSKRPRHSAAAAAPTLKPSPTETLFRLLCPTDKTGGVIGKGGSVIRQIRDATAAKIRVEDPTPGSADSVISIVADSHGGAADGDGSPAQRALVMVFERVSRLAAGAGERAEEEIQGQVVCKLLAASGQVRSVLGVGGRIVEKIRQESGAHIQIVSSREQLIPFAGDDIIHASFWRGEITTLSCNRRRAVPNKLLHFDLDTSSSCSLFSCFHDS